MIDLELRLAIATEEIDRLKTMIQDLEIIILLLEKFPNHEVDSSNP